MPKISLEILTIMASEDQGPITRIIIIVSTIIALICVTLRFFTRVRYLRITTGWEDYTILLAMITSIVSGVGFLLTVNDGNGKHAVFVTYPSGFIKIMQKVYWAIIFFNLSLTFTKTSILLQYMHIFTVREVRIQIYIVAGICVAWGIATFFTAVFACVPVHAFWDITQNGARCLNHNALWYSNTIMNVITSLLIAILPVRTVWRLQIPNHQKIELLLLLTMTWVVCVVSALRFYSIHLVSKHLDDVTYYSARTVYLAALEMNLMIVCASLPAIKPLLSFVGLRGCRGGAGGSGAAMGSLNRGTRGFLGNDLEMGRSVVVTACRSETAGSVHGHHIYVTEHIEQCVEEMERASDGESQKELVLARNSGVKDC